MLDVCLLGTGGMMPLPHRALTSMMIRYNGKSILVDCGEGTQVSVKQQGWSFKPIDAICFTHYHADHISGLPGILLTIGNAERTEPLLLVGPKRLEKVVNSLRIIAPELPFQIEFKEIAEAEESFELCGLHVNAFRLQHNVTCYGYSFELERAGKFDVSKAQENHVPMKYWNSLQKGMVVQENGITFVPDMVLGPERKGLKVTYCTDTRPTPLIEKYASDSDLFICEGMYGEPDSYEKAVAHKHMTMYEAAEIAKRAKVSEMWLTHYSPSLVKPVQYIDEVRKIFPGAVAGKDRMNTVLKFEDEISETE